MTKQIKYTIPAVLQESVKRFADKTSLVYVGEENYTYRQLGDDVAKIAALLKKLGIEKGDKVALLGNNMPNWGKAFFAISWVGATVVPILPDFHTNEVKAILKHSEAKVMFISEGLYTNLDDEITGMLNHLILVENFAVIPKGSEARKLLKLKS
ncbi:MAG: acyl--CoA ligase, partial [Bacteroidales bacterium]|nr:acyl--CoA ligase [Bacteroidales bacterium]